MSDRREFFAETIEEAVAKASATLGVARDQLDFEVLDGGSTGFLGIGARDARIAVDHGRSQATSPVAAGDEVSCESAGREEDSVADDATGSHEVPPAEELPNPTLAEEVPTPAAAEAPVELIVAVDEFMTSLMEAIGFDATVDAYDAGEEVIVDVAVRETGLFIGQKGETIDAIQYLANVAVYKDRPFVKRVIVDSEGYRQRRIEAIQGMAHRTARRALREKRPIGLPPMSAAERRVVHLYLQDHPQVVTLSDGEEEGRRVIVSPA
jgi:spoIIIJ-associated protein